MLPYFPQPTFQFGGATISAFGILAVASILTGWTLTRLYTRRMGLEGEAGSRFARLLVLGGFFGAAAGAAIQVVLTGTGGFSSVRSLTGSGGFSSVGSLIGASSAGILFLKVTHRPARYFDAAALAFPGAWIFFRAGCALAHDHRGAFPSTPLAVQFPEGS